MSHIDFYTKPGCATSGKQIDLLLYAGHEVEVHNLLNHPWTAEELLSYFGDRPVAEWFNPNSPRVKSGEIEPAAYDAGTALELMQADHLLIRRPLMESGGKRLCGFEPDQVHAWVGLGEMVYRRAAGEDFTSCSQPASEVQRCP